MLLRLTPYLYLAITIVLLNTHSVHGCFLGFLGSDCHQTTSSSSSLTPTSTIDHSSSDNASGSATLTSSSFVPSSSSAMTSSSLAPSSSSLQPTSSRHLPSESKSSTTPTSMSSLSPTSSDPSSSSSTPSSSNSNNSDNDKTNTGVIIGAVCGGVAVLAIGFGYAFYSRSRRHKRNQKAALFNDNFNNAPSGDGSPYGGDRPSPAMATAAVAAADSLHYSNAGNPYQQQHQHQQQQHWQQQDGYYPASPTTTPGYGYSNSVASPYQQHQDYYSSAPPMAVAGYPDAGHHGVGGAYYAGTGTDPNQIYDHQYQDLQQQQQQHYQGYDQHYTNTGSATNIASPPPVITSAPTTHEPTYSPPNTYDNHHQKHQ